MVLGFFFPCYLFCAFVCCLLMAMLHVYIYREKLSCCGVFICSCIFSVRTGEVTLYNFTQFYASSCLKIEKKSQTNQNISAVTQKIVAMKQYIQRQNRGKEWQAEHVGTVTQALLLCAHPHNGGGGLGPQSVGVGLGWDWRDIWRANVTIGPLLLCCWIKDKNLTDFWLELIDILWGCKWKRWKEENKRGIFTLSCRPCLAGFLWSAWVCS